jgi:PAS domain S-box-containing protein/putative nucleotidyltransferase with HDIG domain
LPVTALSPDRPAGFDANHSVGVSAHARPRAHRDAYLTGAIALAVGTLATVALAGWVLGIDALKSGVPGLVTMKANTAVCFLATAVALWTLTRAGASAGSARVARLLALLVACVALATLGEYVFATDLGIDQLLFHDPLRAVATSHPGRMAPNSAVAFLFLTGALLQLDRRSRWQAWVAPGFALAAGVLALVALMGYLSGVTTLYAVSTLTQMSVPAAVAFLLLAFGVFSARPDIGPMRLLTSDTVGGTMIRILFPAALAIPLLLGLLRLLGEHTGLYGTDTGIWLFAIAIIAVLVPMTWAVAASLDRAEVSARRAATARGEAQRERAAFDNAPIGTALVSVDGRYQRVNRALCEMTGYSSDELVGMHFANITHPDDRDGDANAVARLRGSKIAGLHREKRYLHADGHDVHAQVEVTPILNADGEPAEFFVQILDITDRKRAERQVEDAHLETLVRLAAAAEYRDDDTGQHTRRVGDLAFQLAEKLGLPKEDARLIRLAAPLHDVGKIAISDAVLLKPAKLTSEEFEQIKRHTTLGAEMLAGGAFPLLATAEEIALTHHERWDGRGYPSGLAATDIPIAGRIVAVADVFDALTHSRPYKSAWTRDAALAEIDRERGGQFDPDVVDAFFAIVTGTDSDDQTISADALLDERPAPQA